MRLTKKAQKRIVYILLEVLYLALMTFIFFFIKNKYSIGGIYDDPLFYCIYLGFILIYLFFWTPVNKLLGMIYTFIFSFYVIGQDIYYLAFHQYCRFATAFDLAGEVAGEGASALAFVQFSDIWPLIFIIVISIGFIILFFFFQKKCYKWWQKLIVSGVSLLLILPIISSYNNFQDQLQESKHTDGFDVFEITKTDYYIYDQMPSTNQVVDKFGLLTFAHRDWISFTDSEEFNQDKVEQVKNFLAQLPDHNNNEMTGIFKDKNVLFIQAESFNNFAIDPALTPNIYKIVKEGISIKGFDTPSLPGSTSDTEFLTNLSIIPNSEGYAASHRYINNTFPVGLPKLFNNLGYRTKGMHNNYSLYYSRNKMFPTYGYQDFMQCTHFGYEDHQDDSTIMNVYKWIPVEQLCKSLDYWITYSGHQPYGIDAGAVGVHEEDVKKIRELYPNLNDEFTSYLAKNMDLDNAVGQFLTEMEKAGRLDNMVIVFFGDHLVKQLDSGADSNFYQATGRTYSTDDFKTGLYIYNSQYAREHGPLVYEKVSTCLDMLPTIANMWGIQYDTKKVMGRDIFDPEYKGFFFSDYQNWKTDNWEYQPGSDTFLYIHNMTEEEARKELAYYQEMKEVCRLILKFDYFKEENK